MKYLNEFIDELLAKGKKSFTPNEAKDALGISYGALKASLFRLSQKKEIVRVVRGLYLILTPEYRKSGCLPPDHLISLLMNYWKIPYYTGLISAAAYYGAAHQQSQIFQVITSKQLRHIHCGKVKVIFITKKNMVDTPIQKVNVPTGYLNLSTVEATVMDLLCYTKASGGLGRVATILEELIDEVDNRKLLEVIKDSKEIAWVQRLGYLLSHVLTKNEKRKQLIQILKKYIQQKNVNKVLLQIGAIAKNYSIDPEWNVVINAKIEMDEL